MTRSTGGLSSYRGMAGIKLGLGFTPSEAPGYGITPSLYVGLDFMANT
ncbi:TPA: hypothetical protein ACHWKL_000732 [Providencia stuartii]|nr:MULTISPECIES: hypothetical protein [Providencia]MBN5561342.1 hypothetical protein [Providencia stuartii]MBN5601088.1 hypothetical protein [Providencia stuartii]MBN5605221.1 hypothetical protein [Providencia stuartii]MCL8325996.1 hypothetical protein [Providencia thailandensis]MDF4173398.1 hypothetical protein [Providencia thailandensis]